MSSAHRQLDIEIEGQYHEIASSLVRPEEPNGWREEADYEELNWLDSVETLERRGGGTSDGCATVQSRESAGDTTFALLECAELVVTPITQSMSLLAWQPMPFCSGRVRAIASSCYFIFIVLVFFYDYSYNALSCIKSSQCTGLVSKYTIPPLIHFSSFLCGAYYFRRKSGMDTSRGLIEAVFLQSTKSADITTAYGDLSQSRLARVLRQYLWLGVVWLAMRMAASGLSSLFATREPILPDGSDVLNTALCAIKVVSGLACDGVYALTITVFSIHCALLCSYVDGWRHRMGQRMHTVAIMKQRALVIQRHVRNLNIGFGWPISLAFLQFAVEICIFAYNIVAAKASDPEIYKASLVFEFITWSVILVFTITEASAVTAKCHHMKAQGIKLRHEGYQNSTREELDSLVVFLMGLRMEVRVFGICISPNSRSLFLIPFSLLILILFRANYIEIAWF